MIKKIMIGLMALTQVNAYKVNDSLMEQINENVLLVSISNEESLRFHDYNKQDFSKSFVKDVEDLTSSYKNEIEEGKYENIEVFNRIYKLTIDIDKINLNKAKRKLENLKFVEDVSYDYSGQLCMTTVNDTYISEQYAIDNIELKYAWDYEKGDESVKVGVIDTGIDSSHPDLIGVVNENLSKSFVASSNGTALQDNIGHGTHVAGIIGATPNDGSYVAGVCWDVTLISLKIVNNNEIFYNSDIAAAINYANENDIKILNASLGTTLYSLSVKNAIENYSGLLICAAGNSNKDTDVYNNYFNSYDLDNIICVGNSDVDNLKEEDSNYGKETVDLFAPGTSILSCAPLSLNSNGVKSMTGTSMAAPYVTGVAALIAAQNSNLTPAQIKTRIMDNVDYVSSLSGICVTGGKLDAYKAIRNSQHIHTNTIEQYDLNYHIKNCSPCGNVLYEAHSWVEKTVGLSTDDYSTQAIATQYVCTVCNQTTVIKPGSIA